jgi:hypothetical protein
VSELEISWASGESEELDYTKREIDEDLMEQERGTAAFSTERSENYLAHQSRSSGRR